MVLGMTQCKKPNLPTSDGVIVNQYVTITAGYSDANSNGSTSKLSMDEPIGNTIKLRWDKGDVINVYQLVNGLEKKVSDKGLHMDGEPTDDGAKATFKGELKGVDTSKKLIFRVGDKPTKEVFNSQDGSFEYIKNNMLCVEGEASYDENANYDVTMGLPYAILKLDLSQFARYKRNLNEAVEVKVTYYDEEDTIATVGGVSQATHEHYIALPTDNAFNAKELEPRIYTFFGNHNLSDCKWTLQQNTFYTANDSGDPYKVKRQFIDMCLPDGLLWGVFELGASEEGERGYFYAWGETEPYIKDGKWCDFASHIPEDERDPKVNGFVADLGYSRENYYIDGEYEWSPQPFGTTVYTNVFNKKFYRMKDEYDAAAAYNPLWRMPTHEEFAKLYNEWGVPYTISHWDYNDDSIVSNYYVSSVKYSIDVEYPIGRDVGFYLYAHGHYNKTNIEGYGLNRSYWTKDVYDYLENAIVFSVNGGNMISFDSAEPREWGCSIIPVRKLKLKR